MESNNHIDEPIFHYSSNEEEVDLQPASDEEEEDEQQSKINSLGGRWYECVFCKRGFTTAQALGGHMNIHRKDRAKNNHTPSISSSSAMSGCYYEDHHQEPYTGPRDYQPILHGGYRPPSPPSLLLSPNLGGTELGYPVYFSDQYIHNNNYGKGLYSCMGDDWSMKLSLQLGSAAAGMVHDYHLERKGERSRVHKELDLELRLGPDP